MKTLFAFFLLLVVTLPVRCAENGFIKLSLWRQRAIALPNNTYNIKGIDVGIGSQTDRITGLQTDLIWAENTYQLSGIAISGLVNISSQIKGLQIAVFNKTTAVTGLQLGAVNLAESLNGMQVAFYNHADTLHGVQFGFLNYTREIEKGIQIGLLNIAENNFLPVMVIANGRF